MNNFCRDLDFGMPLLRPEYPVDSFPEEFHITLDMNVINPDIISLFNNLGLTVAMFEYFWKTPALSNPIHIDGPQAHMNMIFTDYIKINWTFGGGDSTTNWYELKPGREASLYNTPVATTSRRFKSDDVVLIHSQSPNQPSMLQTGIPHQVVNVTEFRRTFSINCFFTATNKRLTWADGCEVFKDYFVN